MAKPKILCPHCEVPLSSEFLYRSVGKLAGSARGAAKRRSPELARKAALARWEKYRKKRKAALRGSLSRGPLRSVIAQAARNSVDLVGGPAKKVPGEDFSLKLGAPNP